IIFLIITTKQSYTYSFPTRRSSDLLWLTIIGIMEKTLIVINDMQSAGVIGEYAIGGAIAAIFYMEPFATHDIDVFITIPSAGMLLSLDHIYQYLESKGYSAIGDAIDIEGWPVQFLPVFNTLLEEALEDANEIDY